MESLFLPLTVDELIDLLDKKYPERCADIHQTERQIFMDAGRRDVVRYLRDLQERTEEAQLANLMEKK